MGQAAARQRGAALAWFASFAGWATLLVIPCWALMGPWQAVLARAAEWTFRHLIGREVDVVAVQVYAPLDLGLFLSLVLAGRLAGMRMPARRVALGAVLLALLELLTAMVILSQELHLLGGALWVRVVRRIGVESLLFAGAFLTWLALSAPPARRRGH